MPSKKDDLPRKGNVSRVATSTCSSSVGWRASHLNEVLQTVHQSVTKTFAMTITHSCRHQYQTMKRIGWPLTGPVQEAGEPQALIHFVTKICGTFFTVYFVLRRALYASALFLLSSFLCSRNLSIFALRASLRGVMRRCNFGVTNLPGFTSRLSASLVGSAFLSAPKIARSLFTRFGP